MKKLFYLVATAILMMTSCSKSGEMIEDEEDLKIKFGSSTMGIDVKARAPINAGDTISNIQLIRVDDHAITAADWSTGKLATTASCTVNATVATQLTVVAKQYYNADSDMYSTFTAYAPAATTFTADQSATTAEWTIDGKTDILVSGSVASGRKTTSATALNFPLEHKLLQLRFYLVANGTAAQSFWGGVTAIEILESPKSVIATLPTATMNFSGDLTGIPVYLNGTDDELSPDDKIEPPLVVANNPSVYTMVAPNTVNTTSKEFKIKVYTENKTSGTELAVTLANVPAAGDSYAITLTFNATTIDFSATLTDWVTGGKTGTGAVE